MDQNQKNEDKYLRTRIPKDLHFEYKKAALEAQRSIEDVTAQLVRDWVASRKAGNDDALDLKAIDLLKLLLAEQKPTDGEIAEVAHTESLSPEALYKLRDRLFPERHNKKKTNGASTQ